MSTKKDMAPKKKFKIVKIEKGAVLPKKQKGRKTKVNLKTEVIPEDEKAVNMELAEEATKGIDKKK